MDELKTGYITKCGQSVRSWKKRWFVLKSNGFLYYYTDPQCKTEKGRIDLINSSRVDICLEVSTAEKVTPDQSGRCFAIVASERTYTCVCDSTEECRSWIQALNKQRDGSDPQQYPAPTYPKEQTPVAPPPYTPHAGPPPQHLGPPMPQPGPPMPQQGPPVPQQGPPMPQPMPYGVQRSSSMTQPPMPQQYPYGQPPRPPQYPYPPQPQNNRYSYSGPPPPQRYPQPYPNRGYPPQPYPNRPPPAPYQSRPYIPPPAPHYYPQPVIQQQQKVNVVVVNTSIPQNHVVIRR